MRRVRGRRREPRAAGVPRDVSVPSPLSVVSVLVLRGGFQRVEHVLLGAQRRVRRLHRRGRPGRARLGSRRHGAGRTSAQLDHDPADRTATVGTTLAPWGLAFIQSYAVDKRLTPRDLPLRADRRHRRRRYDRRHRPFVVVACAATLHASGQSIDDAGDAAAALEPLAGDLATLLFGAGLLGASLLAAVDPAAVDRLFGQRGVGVEASLDDPLGGAGLPRTYAMVVVVAVAVVLIRVRRWFRSCSGPRR